ncbi:Adenosylmethionine-8-amino-7-oxononanoate aminotransferase [Tistlia consotensis]|uniref:Adenosylmethionine-8-amino-7-oxononanoate aminotransferase n=1 Tax=Tistlia consotensis USBA 355 TaxID=560819 RepID=A0A1Y6BUU6_9PROT|nr:aspartate aminotransferase family protein [Tistlia consotensis]SMF22382.1 Adenosylmethionine-8-amino-7-oxononanoate aminotransferase [Tistlia consotensis USBA 355]SNR46023.1 Adenosylmethionine-8-amino-7-oxononanoate aminotransferase [Tistlia consotensis]
MALASALPNRPASHLFYQTRQRRPLVERAEGVWFWDSDGRRYLDGSSGAMVSNIGHSHPHVVEAMRRQIGKATFAYRLHFENEAAETLAAKLVGHLTGDLSRVFFVSGGSEAVESCLKLARQYAVATGQGSRYKVISRFPSYHGCTLGALAVTGYTALTAPFAPMMQEMPKIPAPTAYLDRDALTMEQRGLKYADLLEREILAQGPETVLAFIMEPVGGASTGALVAPDSYYGRVREICDRHGVLLIYDEVMSGAGRTGRFLGGDHWAARPDLVALSKGFAAGYSPLGAAVAPDRIVEPVLDAGGFLHGFTYAGNPLACAAGLAVLEVIENEGLVARAASRGDLLKSKLALLMERYPFIGDVRGKGLLLAFELVADRETMAPLEPSLNAHARLVERAFEQGLIVYSRRTRGGRAGDHILVCPPMVVSESEIDELMAMLTAALDAFAAELKLPAGRG